MNPTEKRKKGQKVEDKIELTLVLHFHMISKEVNEKCLEDPESTDKLIYSQLKVIQKLSSCLHIKPLIFPEGYTKILTPDERNAAHSARVKCIFPEYNHLQDLDFNKLTDEQKEIISGITGYKILYLLGLIDYMYPTADSGADIPALTDKYSQVYHENIKKFPRLNDMAYLHNGELFLNCVTARDQRDLKEFISINAKAVPGIYAHREKKALDNVLKACRENNNKNAILIFGKLHKDGFIELINTEYKDKIVLKEVIDTTLGRLSPKNNIFLTGINKEAMKDFNAGRYEDAAFNFEKVQQFWQATSSFTENRKEKLLSAEYNLGSALFHLAKIDPKYSKDALHHLKLANDLAEEMPALKDDKYKKRYVAALFHLKNSAHWTPSDLPFLMFAPAYFPPQSEETTVQLSSKR